jgi:hypothetical protein
VGIATGMSKMLVLDVDPKDGGLEAYDELCMFIPDIQKGFVVRTGTGGIHVYFKYEGDDISISAGKLGPGLDIRATGGYVVAPPSIHPDTGQKYVWTQHEGEMPALPEPLRQRLLEIKADRTPVPIGSGEKITADRNTKLTSIAGRFRRMDVAEDTMLVTMLSINATRCEPPLPEEEVRKIVKSVCRYNPAESLVDIVDTSPRKFDPNLPKKGKKRLELVSYDNIPIEDMEWLWYGRVAYGKVTLFVGMPGQGKSYATCAIAAAVSRGLTLPDDNFNLRCTPKSVIMFSYEDGQSDTIKPRLKLCGADMSRVFTIPQDKPSFTVDDVRALDDALLERPDVRLVVIDPMQSIMGNADGNNDESVRAKLQPLVDLAATRRVAIVGIKHLNKDEGKSIGNRIGGSIGYAGLARSILLFGHDNQKEYEPGHTYGGVISIKNNISANQMGVTYEVHNNGFTWLGPDPELTVERLMPKKEKQ